MSRRVGISENPRVAPRRDPRKETQMMNSNSVFLKLGAAVLLVSMAVSCGGSGHDGSTSQPVTPTVLSSTPLDIATDVPVNGNASATFSEAMDSATLTVTSFTVTSGLPAVEVAGTVIYANSKATFWPSAHLADNTTYTATITTGATSVPGVALGSNYVWSFTTGVTVEPGLAVNLG